MNNEICKTICDEQDRYFHAEKLDTKEDKSEIS